MTANGDYFYFTENGGYLSNNNLISKYQLVGSNLVKISTITLSGFGTTNGVFCVKNNGTIIIVETTTSKIKFFDNSGSFLKSISLSNFYLSNIFNWNNTIYSAGYSGGIGLLRKINIFD
jgi:hypothetical protein